MDVEVNNCSKSTGSLIFAMLLKKQQIMYGTLINTSIYLRNTHLIGAVKGWWEIEQEMTALNDWTQSVLTLLTRSQ